MAKKSVIARDVKRQKIIDKYKEIRAKLKKMIYATDLSDKERDKVLKKFSNLPRNSSKSRLQRRCMQCGRPHAVYRKFKLCRICLRNTLMTGQVPGGRKASW